MIKYFEFKMFFKFVEYCHLSCATYFVTMELNPSNLFILNKYSSFDESIPQVCKVKFYLAIGEIHIQDISNNF